MRDHQREFGVCAMCRVLGVHRSGFHAWLHQPKSQRARDDERVAGLIKQAWLESGTVYGYRKVGADLRDLGETSSRHRVARLMKAHGPTCSTTSSCSTIRNDGTERTVDWLR